MYYPLLYPFHFQPEINNHSFTQFAWQALSEEVSSVKTLLLFSLGRIDNTGSQVEFCVARVRERSLTLSQKVLIFMTVIPQCFFFFFLLLERLMVFRKYQWYLSVDIDNQDTQFCKFLCKVVKQLHIMIWGRRETSHFIWCNYLQVGK